MPRTSSLSKRLAAAALAFATASANLPLFAQDIEQERQKPARETSTQEETIKASQEAAKMVVPGEEDVTYEQVLTAPDDIELNYKFARTQIRNGDLKGASATLERLLMVNPNMPKVRLLYAIVLFRLDNLIEAQRELETLKGQTLPDELRAQADEYSAQIAKRQKRTHLSGRLSLGWEYDSNRNAAPASDTRLFGDTPLQLVGPQQRESDTSMLFMGNVEAHHDLGTQAGHELFGSMTYYRAEQTQIKLLNLQAYSFQGGAVYKTPYVDFTPTLLFDHILLEQTTFLRNHGASLRAEHRIDKRTSIFAEVRDVVQQYSPTQDIPTAGDRTGAQIDVTAGADHVLGPTMRVGAAATHTVKHATQSFDAFERDGLMVHHDWLLGKGTFLLSSVTMNYDQYDEPDFFTSAKYRRDTTVRANATFGAPLDILSAKLKNLIWTLTYEYYEASSTVRNFAYTNNKLATLVTYRWDAGF